MNYLTLLLLLPTTSFVQSATTPDTATVRQVIGRTKVAAFSRDYLIKSGLDDNDLKKWDDSIKKSLGYIAPSKHEKLLPNADRLFYTLDNANAFVKESVKNLNSLYSSHYVKKDGKYIPDFTTKPMQPADLNKLTAFNKQAQDLQAKVVDVAQQAFPRSYVDAQPAPDSWVKMYIKNAAGKLKAAEELFPKYEELLKNYAAVNNNYTDFKNKFGAQYGLKMGDEKSFTALVEKIERCAYRLGEKKLSGGKERTLLTKLAHDIRGEFPTLYTSLDFYKIPKSTSMQRTILSAYAEAMEGVLNQIIRETKTLLEAAKAANK